LPKLSDFLNVIARRSRSNLVLMEIASHLIGARNDRKGNGLNEKSLNLGLSIQFIGSIARVHRYQRNLKSDYP
ncbi:MAG: hypothetical protein KAU38_09775, partial [Desulfobacterales bacterium]|nr:hypothetical protein [Desulfobacterales bacterium]